MFGVVWKTAECRKCALNTRVRGLILLCIETLLKYKELNTWAVSSFSEV